jgi:hypothetical protein
MPRPRSSSVGAPAAGPLFNMSSSAAAAGFPDNDLLEDLDPLFPAGQPESHSPTRLSAEDREAFNHSQEEADEHRQEQERVDARNRQQQERRQASDERRSRYAQHAARSGTHAAAARATRPPSPDIRDHFRANGSRLPNPTPQLRLDQDQLAQLADLLRNNNNPDAQCSSSPPGPFAPAPQQSAFQPPVYLPTPPEVWEFESTKQGSNSRTSIDIVLYCIVYFSCQQT